MTSEVEAHGVLVTVAQAANGAVAVTIYAQTADGPVSVVVNADRPDVTVAVDDLEVFPPPSK
jgi:hypothetical protein